MCTEVNLNQGISFLFIWGQLKEVPKILTKFWDHFAPKIVVASLWGKLPIRNNSVRDSRLELPWLPLLFFSFTDYSFPSMFPQICKKCWQKKKSSNICLVFNNIKSNLSVFVILILRLWAVVCYFM